MAHFNHQQNEWAEEIAAWLCKQESNLATHISQITSELVRQIGQDNYKVLIMIKIENIRAGISASYAGPQFLRNALIHKKKQRAFNEFYKRLIRERVAPDVYAVIRQNVSAGSFVKASLIDEHLAELQADGIELTIDDTAAHEDFYTEIIQRLKNDPDTAGIIVQATANHQAVHEIEFDDEEESSSSSDEEEQEEEEEQQNSNSEYEPSDNDEQGEGEGDENDDDEEEQEESSSSSQPTPPPSPRPKRVVRRVQAEKEVQGVRRKLFREDDDEEGNNNATQKRQRV